MYGCTSLLQVRLKFLLGLRLSMDKDHAPLNVCFVLPIASAHELLVVAFRFELKRCNRETCGPVTNAPNSNFTGYKALHWPFGILFYSFKHPGVKHSSLRCIIIWIEMKPGVWS